MLHRELKAAAFAVWFITAFSAAAQGVSNGLYQIVSGQYSECCGFVGIPDTYSLPYSNQTVVELLIDQPANLARLRVLGQDKQTVFCTDTFGGNDLGFCFTLTNGTIFADHIQFENAGRPQPGEPYVSYVISNSPSGIEINGTVVTTACCDIPNTFSHSNVLAVLIDTNELVIDAVQRKTDFLTFHFVGNPPNDYTVQYSDPPDLTNWFKLITYRAKIASIDVVVTNWFANAPARFFRVQKQPCNCR